MHCIDVTQTGRLHTLTSIIPQSIALPLGIIMAAFGLADFKGWGRKWQLISLDLGEGSMLVGPLMSVPSVLCDDRLGAESGHWAVALVDDVGVN